jgi:replicative DNA helicase
LILESEQAVIGSILLRSEILPQVQQRISYKDFTEKANGRLFKAISKVAKDGYGIDATVIAAEEPSLTDHLGGIIHGVGTSVGWEYHVERMLEVQTRRDLLKISTAIRDGVEGKAGSPEILSDVKRRITQLGDTGSRTTEPLADVLPRVLDSMGADSKPGVKSGFPDIDQITGGWQAGELVVIAGRPGMGKSLLAKDFAEASKVPTLIFSLEMSKAELVKRQISGVSRVDFESIRTSNVADEDWDKVVKAANTLARMPIHYNDSGRLTIGQLCAIAESKKLTDNIGLVIIDYLQLIKSTESAEKREREVALMIGDLKGLARSLEIPIICLSQLNRNCEKRVPPKPQLSDLRESGAIEQDADIVGFVFRPWVYNKDANPHEAHFNIAKSRNTRTGAIKLVFDGSIQRFDSAVRGNDYG